MNRSLKTARAGFTLVELLAVVLVLSVLAAIAVPLYLNTRKTSAARACLSNIASIAAAESAYSTRFGKYVKDGTSNLGWQATYAQATTAGGDPATDGLIGAPEGLASIPKCPLGGDYTVASNATTATSIDITCPNAAAHASATGAAASKWTVILVAPGTDNSNPL